MTNVKLPSPRSFYSNKRPICTLCYSIWCKIKNPQNRNSVTLNVPANVLYSQVIRSQKITIQLFSRLDQLSNCIRRNILNSIYPANWLVTLHSVGHFIPRSLCTKNIIVPSLLFGWRSDRQSFAVLQRTPYNLIEYELLHIPQSEVECCMQVH